MMCLSRQMGSLSIAPAQDNEIQLEIKIAELFSDSFQQRLYLGNLT